MSALPAPRPSVPGATSAGGGGGGGNPIHPALSLGKQIKGASPSPARLTAPRHSLCLRSSPHVLGPLGRVPVYSGSLWNPVL